MLWLKALHLVFMVTWFAGLFYLPRLYVYHAMSEDRISIERFKLMERKLFWGIMTPGGILTWLFGLGMLHDYAWAVFGGPLWLQLKLGLLFALSVYHVYCGALMSAFRRDRNRHGHRWYRVFNEIPVIFLFAIVWLAVFRPA